MKRKRSSPAASETEFDISSAIANAPLGLDDDSDIEIERKDLEPWRNDVINLEETDSENDGDEAQIAAMQAASNRKGSNLKGRTVKKGGGFQAMGLNAALFKAITKKGFSVPTPIQRKTIPLILEGGDVVGMARTGSGKTAAFVIPMIQKLKAHSATQGARALILSPSRELALQTLKVVKELRRGTDLRCALVVGGDSLDEQFDSMTTNPDIIIATPGRFLHVKVEMKMDLQTVEYVVFDEADRLFEMGFAVQLAEIMVGLSPNRQTLLFSATLPKSLVEFARAGLQEPKLVRLDAESKISPDLESAFFMVKNSEKEGALLQIIQDVIKIPTLSEAEKPKLGDEEEFKIRKKRKKITEKSGKGNFDSPTEYSTIIFAATKHHVEYLATMLKFVGHSVSYVYGALDQTARKMQVQDFRDGITNILVVTDVAARGVDIPILANVINYDFPSQPKVFVHRVGRTARAGKKGWSYSILQDADLPYLLDLQLFLSRKLVIGRSPAGCNFSEDIVVGALPAHKLGANCEWANKLVEEEADIDSLKDVAAKGERLYVKTRNSASIESVKRAKELQSKSSLGELCALFQDEIGDSSTSRDDMLARIKKLRPQETVFEFGQRGVVNETVETIRKTRKRVTDRATKQKDIAELSTTNINAKNKVANDTAFSDSEEEVNIENMSNASEDELEITFSTNHKGSSTLNAWQDSEHFMSYAPRESNLAEDRGYGVLSGGSGNTRPGSDFFSQAKDATMDLANDEAKGFATNQAKMRWDKRSKKYVARANDEDGSKGAKMVRGESGLKIAASLRSGRFDDWKKKNNIGRLPRAGEVEAASKSSGRGGKGENARYRHKAEKAPKEADRWRDDYHVQKKRVMEAKENRIGRFRDGAGKNELKSIDDVRKQRALDERKKARGGGRPSARGSSRGGTSRGGGSSRGGSSRGGRGRGRGRG